jgi:2-C-methyl-D-erythritol 4-phosphate cytidylyltransferase
MSGFALILPAAGSGRRLGNVVPKPYIRLEGRTILEVTLGRFKETGRLEQVVIPTSGAYMDEASDAASRLFGAETGVKVSVIEGGAERQDSIANALAHVDDRIGWICIHDAVRPFVKPSTILSVLERAEATHAAILAVPAKDTIKQALCENNRIWTRFTPDRSTLWQAQTPQIFASDLIRRAYREAAREGFIGTDDASLVERLGHDVDLVEGGRENFKITYPVDLQLAELLLRKESDPPQVQVSPAPAGKAATSSNQAPAPQNADASHP